MFSPSVNGEWAPWDPWFPWERYRVRGCYQVGTTDTWAAATANGGAGCPQSATEDFYCYETNPISEDETAVLDADQNGHPGQHSKCSET